MTTPADDGSEAPLPGRFEFQFSTPFGTYNSIDDLPPHARAFVIENLDGLGLSDAERDALAAHLQLRGRRQARHARAADESTPAVTDNGHLPGCTCEQDHRDQVWSMLDTAFPNEPHLWRAGEALFTLSAANPHRVSSSERQTAARQAARHLEHHAARLAPAAPSMSPADEIVGRFREELGGL